MNRGVGTVAPGATPIGQLIDQIIPPGVIWEWAGPSLPDPAIYGRWAWADGSALNRVEYPRLFAHIGVAHGAGDGNKTFNVPNRKGRVGVGFDGTTEFLNLGTTGGAKTVTIAATQIPAHTHGFSHNHGTLSSPNIDHGHNANHDHGTGTEIGSHGHGTYFTNFAMGQIGAGVNTGSTAHDHHSTNDNQYATCPGGANSFAGYGIINGSHQHSGAVSGEDTGHTHYVNANNFNTAGMTANATHSHTLGTQSSSTTDNGTGGGLSTPTLPPYVSMNYIIKVG